MNLLLQLCNICGKLIYFSGIQIKYCTPTLSFAINIFTEFNINLANDLTD